MKINCQAHLQHLLSLFLILIAVNVSLQIQIDQI